MPKDKLIAVLSLNAQDCLSFGNRLLFEANKLDARSTINYPLVPIKVFDINGKQVDFGGKAYTLDYDRMLADTYRVGYNNNIEK
jgi:hypothetical protein